MELNTNVVGEIKFDGHVLNVYSSLNEPIFMATEVSRLIDYSDGNTKSMIDRNCESDEYLNLPVVSAGQMRQKIFVTEMGLYNILSQSRKPIARKWRRVVHQQLIDMRKDKTMDIIQQFDEWDHEADGIFFDEETGLIMQSVTIAGGDVDQIPLDI